jgi:hypothetical protein
MKQNYSLPPWYIDETIKLGDLEVLPISSDEDGDEVDRPADVAYIPPSYKQENDANPIVSAPKLLTTLKNLAEISSESVELDS